LIDRGLNRIHRCSEALAPLAYDPPAFKRVGGKNQARLQLVKGPIERD
jgi:hypothetical protein